MVASYKTDQIWHMMGLIEYILKSHGIANLCYSYSIENFDFYFKT